MGRRPKNQSWEKSQVISANRESRTWAFHIPNPNPEGDPNEDCDGVGTEDFSVEQGTGEPPNPLGGGAIQSLDGTLKYESQYARYENATNQRMRGLRFTSVNPETGQTEFKFCSNRAPNGEWQAFREPVISTAQLHCYNSTYNVAKSIAFREYEPGASYTIAVKVDNATGLAPNEDLLVWQWVGDPHPDQLNKQLHSQINPLGGMLEFSPTDEIFAISVSSLNPMLVFDAHPDGMDDTLWFQTEGAQPDFNGNDVITLNCMWFDPPI